MVRVNESQSWSEDDIRKAVEDVKRGGKLSAVSKLHNVPRETLRRKVKLLVKEEKEEGIALKSSRFSTIFCDF